MNHREETKKNFRTYQTERFLQITHRYPQLADAHPWNEEADEYMKDLLRGKSIDEYFDNIFAVLNELIDRGHLPLIAASAFGYWCTKVEDDIRNRVRRRDYSAIRARSPKNVFERHRKTIKPQLQKYVDAYKLLKELSKQTDFSIGSETGTAGYLENNDYTHVHPGFDALGEMLKKSISNQDSLSLEITTKDDLDVQLKRVYNDFLEVRLKSIATSGEEQKFFFQFQNDDITVGETVHHLGWAIVHFAEERFGDEGRLIADIMIEGKNPEEFEDKWHQPRKQKKGRPKELHVDRAILYLNELGVDELWIARFINAIENKERYKLVSDEAEWSVRDKKMKSLSQSNVRKAIQQRIKKIGGNSVRFEIDRLIQDWGECSACDWRYNEQGILMRLPCKLHLGASKTFGGGLPNPGFMRRLEKEGFSFFANSLTFVPEETKSPEKKNKKRN